ncbi:MAG TPA: hypothetical protein VD866_08550 [Urbifossiella sp.]|nr:hypothetical protein [Urbifossiella sp.]
MRFIWNPDGFRPDDFLPSRLRHQADAARVLVHLIEYRRLDKRYKAHDGVTLQAKFLRNVVGVEHCEAIRDCLAAQGVISVRRSYTVGLHSFEFKIGPLFKSSPFRRVQVTDKFLIGRMDRHLSRTVPDPHDPTEVGLFSWLKELTIDAPAAKAYASTFGEGAEWVRQKALSIDMIEQADHWFTRDRFRRVHTNFTNLWGGLRRFLAVGGEQVVELDIANSQPLFFGLLALAKWQLSQDGEGEQTVLSEMTIPRRLIDTTCNNSVSISPPPIPSLYDAGMHAGSQRYLPHDLANYMTLVQRGTIYEFLMDKARRTWEDRGEFKESFFQHVFYAKTPYPNALANVFRQEFPSAHRILTDLKANEPRDAPRKMQQLEADFVIDTCCRKLLTTHPQVPLLTLHDGIWTTSPHIGLVRQTVEAEFAKLGVHPLLRCRAANGLSLPPDASVQT